MKRFPPQPALNSVQVLEYAILPGGKIIIKLVFKHELTAPPAVFASYHPTARIVLDFADTASETGKDLLEVGRFGLRSLQLVQAGTRTRMVINLARPVGYETAVKGKELLITLQPAQAATRSDIPGRFSGATLDAPRHSVREVGFERGENGAGRVIVELSNTTTPIDIRQQGKTLIVDFLDSALPRQMERRLDVRDFGTAVKAIESYRLGNHVRVKIELERAGEYSAYQVSRQLVVSPR
jgi:type IV pilus assembly protein PilQ